MSSGRLGPQRVDGYILLEPIGSGGAGTVYRARQEQGERLVALKLGNALDPVRLERFRREGEITAALRHPNIVPIHDAGAVGQRPYLVYPLVEDAQTLDEVLDAWPLRRRVEALRDLARALGFAHQRGVVHRDVKPANVLVTTEGAVLLADFGLAAADDLDRMTRTGVMLGTPLYLAPEVAREGSKGTTPQADVYSLGVMLYEALLGEHPYAAQGFGAVMDPKLRRVRTPSSQSRDIPVGLSRVCMQAMADDPSRRYADGDQLADALDDWLAGRAPGRRRAPGWLLAGALGLAALAALGVATLAQAPAPASSPAASAAPEPDPQPTPSPTPERARTPAQEQALRALLQRLPGLRADDARLIPELKALASALRPDEPASARLADRFVALLHTSDWKRWGLAALRALTATGARPGDPRRAERLCEVIWGAHVMGRIDQAGFEQAYVDLVRMDVDLDGMHNCYQKRIPGITAETPPELAYLRERARLRKGVVPDDAPAHRTLLALARRPELGSTTRARALAVGLRVVSDPQERLRLAAEAARLDPSSAHVRLAHVHARLYAGDLSALADLGPAWTQWRAHHRERPGSKGEESALLDRSLRRLLQHRRVAEAEALLKGSFLFAGMPIEGHARRRRLLDAFKPAGRFTEPRHQRWLETGVLKLRRKR